MDIATLKTDLIRDEGIRLKPYRDDLGVLTIGVGHNLDDMGITRAEADYLLENDIGRAMTDLDRNIKWWRDMPAGPQIGLVNMAFNLGWTRLSGFAKMLSALESGDYQTAATEALDSDWADQVGDRAQHIAELIRRDTKDEGHGLI